MNQELSSNESQPKPETILLSNPISSAYTQRKQQWQCEICGVTRTWGASEANLTPSDYKPLLNCAGTCGKPTRHTFVGYNYIALPHYMYPDRIDIIRCTRKPYEKRAQRFQIDLNGISLN